VERRHFKLRHYRALRELVRETLERIDQPVLVASVNPDLPAGKLARVLWMRRMGSRRTALLRTKLHCLVTAEARARRNGRNGHAS
jgi:hypothetical protein